MIAIGIDPGKGGGIAVLFDSGVACGYPMPTTERDVCDILSEFDETIRAQPVAARIERVASSPQMGVVSAFTFGRGYGGLLMALTALRIPFEEVLPRTWQKELGCLTGGDKNVSKRRAQQLFPQLKVTHAIADALLIAEFCRRTHKG